MPYALLAWRYWFLCDDAFISFRYAKHLARGQGLAFNPDGQWVEGYSNTLWVLVAALCEAALVSPLLVMPAISAACGAILVWRVAEVAHGDLGLSREGALVGGLWVAAAPAAGVWASSGLETMAFALLLWLAFEAVVLREGRAAVLGGAAALLGLILVRAEGPGWAAVLLGLGALARWREGRSLRVLAVPAAVALVGFGLLEGFRLWAFGDWVPNTARAKVAFDRDVGIRGLKYVALYSLSFPVQVLAVGAAPAAIRARPGAGLAAALLAVGVPLWAVLVGGDFFPMGRMLLAGLGFLGLLAAAGVSWLAERQRPAALALGLVAVGVSALPAVEVHLVPESVRESLHFRLSDRGFLSEHGRWQNLVDNTEKFVLRGQALAENTRRGETIVARAIGAMGYFSGLVVYDQYGLIDPEVASRPLGPGPLERSPGHDREVEAIFFADRDPDYLFARYVRGDTAAIQMDQSLRRWAVPNALRDRYVPEFLEHTVEGELERGFLFLVRRVRSGEDPAAVWLDFEARRRALHRELKG